MKFNNISKLLIILILSITNLEAGFIMKKIKSKAKDKIKDVVVNTTKDVYSHKKKKRRDYEAKTNTKSTLSKAEDKYEATKQKVKETAIEAVGGQKNVEFIKRGKERINQGLKGELKD